MKDQERLSEKYIREEHSRESERDFSVINDSKTEKKDLFSYAHQDISFGPGFYFVYPINRNNIITDGIEDSALSQIIHEFFRGLSFNPEKKYYPQRGEVYLKTKRPLSPRELSLLNKLLFENVKYNCTKEYITEFSQIRSN